MSVMDTGQLSAGHYVKSFCLMFLCCLCSSNVVCRSIGSVPSSTCVLSTYVVPKDSVSMCVLSLVIM